MILRRSGATLPVRADETVYGRDFELTMDDMAMPGRWRLLILLALVMAAGCRSTIYDPHALPLELHVAPVSNIEELDLSRLASRALRNDMIYRGDILKITVATGIEQQGPQEWYVRVANDGTIDVPLIARVAVDQLDVFTAEQAIRQAAMQRAIYRNPAITVSVDQRHSHKVTVVGAVEKPGTYELPAFSSDLLAALVAAEGLTDEADTIVEIRHPPQTNQPQLPPLGPGPTIANGPRAEFAAMPNAVSGMQRPGPVRIDLLAATHQRTPHLLEDGAVVMVMKRPLRVIHVLGLVYKPGQYELPRNKDIRVIDAIALAGGVSMNIANKVYVIRQSPTQTEPIVIEVSLRQTKHDSQANLLLASGDVISVEETPLTIALGTLQRFVNVGIGLSGGIPIF